MGPCVPPHDPSVCGPVEASVPRTSVDATAGGVIEAGIARGGGGVLFVTGVTPSVRDTRSADTRARTGPNWESRSRTRRRSSTGLAGAR